MKHFGSVFGGHVGVDPAFWVVPVGCNTGEGAFAECVDIAAELAETLGELGADCGVEVGVLLEAFHQRIKCVSMHRVLEAEVET